MRLEQQIQKEIIKYLHGVGAYTFKTVNSNRAGIPDVIVCINGKFIAFEIKRPNGKATPLQELEIKKITQAKGIAKVVHSVDEVKSIVGSIENE
jgi:Holliday junction resolvase